jgi:methyl-accepting chemotaxis protein
MQQNREEVALVNELLARQKSYLAVQKEVFALKDSGRTQEVDQLAATTLKTTFDSYAASITALLDYQTRQAQALADDSAHEYDASVATLLAFGLAGLAIGVVLAWAITRSIVGPLRHAVDIAERVAQGDLRDFNVVERYDEIGQLLAALHHMTARLGATVRLVRDSAVTIDVASRELSTGNSDLSRRTEQQAGALEETASSMEELTSTVKENTSSAQQAVRRGRQRRVGHRQCRQDDGRDQCCGHGDCRYHRCDRWHRVSNEHPRAQCRGRGGPCRRTRPRLCRGGG